MRKTARLAATLLTAGAATVAFSGVASAAPAAAPAPPPQENPANIVYQGVIGAAGLAFGAGYNLTTGPLYLLINTLAAAPH